MKRLIVMMVVLVMCSNVFAEGLIPDIDLIDIDNKATSSSKSNSTSISCSTSGSLSNSILKQDINYEEKLQGVPTDFPSHLWMTPRDKFFWNQLGFDPALLTKIAWTEQAAKNVVDTPKIPFVRCKMRVVVHNFLGKKSEESELLTLSLTPPSDEYVFTGSVNVTVRKNGKNLTTLICIGRAVEAALEQGADLVVLEHGLNTVNQGSSFGLGTTLISSSGNNAVTGAGGIGSADTKQRGEPAAILTMYKSKVAMQAAAQASAVDVETPKKPSPIDGLFQAVGSLFAKKPAE